MKLKVLLSSLYLNAYCCCLHALPVEEKDCESLSARRKRSPLKTELLLSGSKLLLSSRRLMANLINALYLPCCKPSITYLWPVAFNFLLFVFWDRLSYSLGWLWTHYVARDDWILIFLPSSLEFWYYRCVSPLQVYVGKGSNLGPCIC